MTCQAVHIGKRIHLKIIGLVSSSQIVQHEQMGLKSISPEHTVNVCVLV